MTPGEISAIRSLVTACTGGGERQWWINEQDGGICCGPDGADVLEVGYTDMNEADTALVVSAPLTISRLLGEVERLGMERDESLAVSQRIWSETTWRREATDVENATAERIAEWLEPQGSVTEMVKFYRGLASRIRAGDWRSK